MRLRHASGADFGGWQHSKAVVARLRKTLSAPSVWPPLFLSPALVCIAIVYVFPMFHVLALSVQRKQLSGVQFVGLSNYVYVLTKDATVKAALRNNLTLLLAVPILLVLSIFFAVLLYEGIRGTRFFQAIILTPYLTSIPVIGLVLGTMLREDGLINFVLESIGLSFLAKDWLGSSDLAIFTILGLIVWRELGLGTSLFLAQLLTVSREVFDAAKVDGANWRQSVIYVAVPQLRTMVIFYAVYNVIIVFAWTFNYIFVMTYGGPGYSTMVFEYVIYRLAVSKGLWGPASALSVVLFLGILVFVYIQMRLRKSIWEVV